MSFHGLRAHFFLGLKNIPLSGWTTVYSPPEGHISCLWVLTIINKATVDIPVQVFVMSPMGDPNLRPRTGCVWCFWHPRPGPFAEKTPWIISQETSTYTPSQATPPKRQGALHPLPYVLPTCVLFDQHRNIKRPLFKKKFFFQLFSVNGILSSNK